MWPRKLIELAFEISGDHSPILSAHEVTALLSGSSVTSQQLVDKGLFTEYEEQECVRIDSSPQSLLPHPETGEPSYFDGYDIVAVEREDRLFYRLQQSALVDWLYQGLNLPEHNTPKEFIPDVLWYMGDVRIPNMGFVPVWYGQALADNQTTIGEVCQIRSRGLSGLMLTHSPSNLTFSGIKAVIEVEACLCPRSEMATVDWNALAYSLRGFSPEDSPALPYRLSPDGNALIPAVGGEPIRLRQGKVRDFFHYVMAELAKNPDIGVDFYKARDYAGYAASADTFGKMWSPNSIYHRLVRRENSRIYLVPWSESEVIISQKATELA